MILYLDFETYYRSKSASAGEPHNGVPYSLRGMSTTEYIRDPQFQVTCVAVAIDNGPVAVLSAEQLRTLLSKLHDRNDVVLVGHNLKFDGFILAEHFDWYPKLYVDTMGMSRALIGAKVKSHSLDSIGEYLQCGRKTGALAKADGLRLEDLEADPDLFGAYKEYAKGDVEITRAVYHALRPEFPRNEYEPMDWTIRAFTRPILRLDIDKLDQLHTEEQARKADLLAQAGVPKTRLMSNDKFADLLRVEGVDPPTKKNPKGQDIYAFAKTDESFVALLADPDTPPTVRTLVEARLTCKSTILETRAASYAKHARRGAWPVDLHYAGASATQRLSGGPGGGGNPQNLSRGSSIRGAITAPDGHTLIACDLSNIELRVCHLLCGQQSTIDVINASDAGQGDDLYCVSASNFYGERVYKAGEDDPDYDRQKFRRQLGKVVELSAQFGTGHVRLRNTAWTQGNIQISEAEARQAIQSYRARNTNITASWQAMDYLFKYWAHNSAPPPGEVPLPVDFLRYEQNKITRPSGLSLQFPNLRMETVQYENGPKQQLVFDSYSKSRTDGRGYVYGAKGVQLLTQSLARDILTEMAVKIDKKYNVAMQVHDEVVCVVRDEEVEEAKQFIFDVMTAPPTWWPDLPVAAEIATGRTYLDAK